MKYCLTLLFAVVTSFCATAQTKTVYYDMQGFTLLGRPMPNQTVYQRFPDTIKNLLRKPVWDLSKNPTGFAVYFETNAKQISAKWKTGSSVVFQHVAGTLVKGLDLYGLDNGSWYFAGVGKPNAPVYQESNLVKDMDGTMRQYLLYYLIMKPAIRFLLVSKKVLVFISHNKIILKVKSHSLYTALLLYRAPLLCALAWPILLS